MSVPSILRAQSELMHLIAGRPITLDLLFELVPALDLNQRVSILDTKNFSLFFRGGVRYFFTVYGESLAYRICMIDEGPHAEEDIPVEGYVGFLTGVLGELGDGYTKLHGDYEVRGLVEIVTYTK